jgi:hypothetical protein
MPNLLDELSRTIAATIASGRIGRVVFVRATLALDSGMPVEPLFHAVAGLGTQWIGEPAESVYAAGSPQQHALATMLTFRGGQTALVSCGPAGAATPLIDLAVVGSRGAVYHHAAAGAGWTMSPPVAAAAGSEERFAAALRRSLASRRPEPITAEAKS